MNDIPGVGDILLHLDMAVLTEWADVLGGVCATIANVFEVNLYGELFWEARILAHRIRVHRVLEILHYTTNIRSLKYLLVIFDKGSIEGEATDQFVLEAAFVSEAKVQITRQLKLLIDVNHHLLHIASSLLLNDSLLTIIDAVALEVHTVLVLPDDWEVLTVDYLHKGFALAGARHIRNCIHNDLFQRFQDRWTYPTVINLLEVFNISDLAGLCHTLSMMKALPTVVCDGGMCCGGESAVNKVAAY